MRIWSIHPKYLDAKGIVALWRETLLAKNVLADNTKGYKNHPQLDRFKRTDEPLVFINQYLLVVYEESVKRGYNFSRDKVSGDIKDISIPVTRGQLIFEFEHFLNKMQKRNPKIFLKFKEITFPEVHPLFTIVEGNIEKWEIV